MGQGQADRGILAKARIYSRRATLKRAGQAGSALAWLSLTACGRSRGSSRAGGSAQSQQPVYGGTLNSNVRTSPETLDVFQSTGASSTIVAGHVQSRLFMFNSGTDPNATFNNDIIPDLAVSHESADAITWTFKLRPGARFQNIAPVNGRAVEAEDVKASFQRALNTAANPGRADITMIDANQIEAPSSDTVVFKLKYAYGPFLNILGRLSNPIFPREAATGAYDPTKTVIGSGPFTLDSYSPDIGFVFKKNPTWYQQAQPYIDASKVAVIPNDAQALSQFTAGNLDILSPSTADLNTAQHNNPNVQLIAVYDRSSTWVLFGHMNLPNSAFRDVRIRQALSISIDRDAIGKAILGNRYYIGALLQPAFGKWTLPLSRLGDAAKNFKYDPQTAKQLLSAAGGGDQFHNLYYPTGGYGPQFEKTVQTMNAMLNQVGFKTTLAPLDYHKDFLNGGKGVSYGNYPADGLVVANVGAYLTPEDFLVANFTPGAPRDKSQVDDADLAAMLTKMSAQGDENERLQSVFAIQKYLAEKLYYIPAPYPYAATLIKPRVKNFQYSTMSYQAAETFPKLWLSS